MKQTTTPATASRLKNYGYQFWLNGTHEDNPSEHLYPDVPADMFFCDGYASQEIYIIPSKKLVVVRLGLTLDGSFNENAFLKDVLAAVKH